MLVTTMAVLGVCTAWEYGVDGYVETVSGQGITAMYDDGEPMSYAAVEIKAPGADVAFQTGRTDRNGYFMVNPDTPGDWKAIVTDGMGHRLELGFTVEEGQEKPEQPAQPSGPADRPVNRSTGIVAGLSVIFGLFGIVYGWTGRRKSA